MKVRIFMLIVVIAIITSCAVNKDQIGEVEKYGYWAKIDSLKEDMIEINYAMDSLYLHIEELNFTIDSLYQALEISNSRVAVHTDFEIPDSIVFAGRTFDLTSERLRDKIETIYQLELKSAHKYIPRSGKYFAIFDSIFARYDIPPDAKYLAVAESRLSSMATSRAGAVGVWQFMKSTATGFGLKVNTFVDERRDVLKATEAAAKLLKNNYNYISERGAQDWLLSMSAYNAGAGSIAKVIREQGGTDFFDLILKSDESHQYVWRAVAIKIIFENQERIFGKKFELEAPLFEQVRVEKLHLNGHYRIDDWAIAQGTTIGKVWEYNPWIKIYQRSRKKYSPINDVVLPPGDFSILIPKLAEKNHRLLAQIENDFKSANAGYFAYHIVKKGDTLYDIAKKYKTTISRIKQLNGLKSNIINPGQKLRLYGASNSGNCYIVKKGDSVSKIAGRLGLSTQHLIAVNNLKWKNGIIIINPGQKLFY